MNAEHLEERLFAQQLRRWPEAQLQDLLKAAYQSAYGPGHLVREDARELLTAELDALNRSEDPGVEPLAGGFCRFHLGHLEALGLSPDTLYRAFARSAPEPAEAGETLERLLSALETMAREHRLSWEESTVSAAVERWRAAGFPACHHSPEFRNRYHPAYRVLRREYGWMAPLLGRIDRLLAERGGGIVAIDGGSASGKTTLAAALEGLYDCQVFHMDDFFLRPEQRTEARFAEPGGNVDRERFLEEVLLPVTRRETVQLRRYDCTTQTLCPVVEKPWKPLTIIEGAYSLHRDLAEHYDLTAFLRVAPALQHRRIEKRNTPELQTMFFTRWIPLEQRYFEAMDVKARCDLTLEVEE